MISVAPPPICNTLVSYKEKREKKYERKKGRERVRETVRERQGKGGGN